MVAEVDRGRRNDAHAIISCFPSGRNNGYVMWPSIKLSMVRDHVGVLSQPWLGSQSIDGYNKLELLHLQISISVSCILGSFCKYISLLFLNLHLYHPTLFC